MTVFYVICFGFIVVFTPMMRVTFFIKMLGTLVIISVDFGRMMSASLSIFMRMVKLYQTLFALLASVVMWMTWGTRTWWNLLGTVARICSMMMLWTWTWWRWFFRRRATAVSFLHIMTLWVGLFFRTGNKASWLGDFHLVFCTLTFTFSPMSYDVLHFIEERLLFAIFHFLWWSLRTYTQLFLLPLLLTFGGLKVAHHN